MTKWIQHRLEFLLVKLLIWSVNRLPVRLALRLGDVFGVLIFSIFRYRRKVSLGNLRHVFGNEMSGGQLKRIARKAYINFCRSLIEFCLFPTFAKMDLSRNIRVVGDAPLRQHFASGQGAVLFSGHFGSWELIGAYLAQQGWPIDFLVGVQKNLLVNDLMNQHRRIFGIGLIEIGTAARGVFSAIRRGRGVAMLADQDAGSDGVVINFLGRPASTAKGPAAFALKTGCPIFVGSMVREGLDRHVLYVEGPISIQAGNDKEDDIRRLTQAYSDVLADYVYRYPDHWLWSHRRWKSTCPQDYL